MSLERLIRRGATRFRNSRPSHSMCSAAYGSRCHAHNDQNNRDEPILAARRRGVISARSKRLFRSVVERPGASPSARMQQETPHDLAYRGKTAAVKVLLAENERLKTQTDSVRIRPVRALFFSLLRLYRALSLSVPAERPDAAALGGAGRPRRPGQAPAVPRRAGGSRGRRKKSCRMARVFTSAQRKQSVPRTCTALHFAHLK